MYDYDFCHCNILSKLKLESPKTGCGLQQCQAIRRKSEYLKKGFLRLWPPFPFCAYFVKPQVSCCQELEQWVAATLTQPIIEPRLMSERTPQLQILNANM